jgi:hypothetical protein
MRTVGILSNWSFRISRRGGRITLGFEAGMDGWDGWLGWMVGMGGL